MPQTLIKPRLRFIKPKQKRKPQMQNTTSTSPSNLETFEKHLLSGYGFVVVEDSKKRS